jgi:hypothetical protein
VNSFILSPIIFLAASQVPSAVDNWEQSKASDLEVLWQSYRHAEYEATGGYNCDRKQHKIIVNAFERRFSKRVAKLRSAAAERLDGHGMTQSLEVIAICRKYTDLNALKKGLDRDLASFEATLVRTENAFGIKWGN